MSFDILCIHPYRFLSSILHFSITVNVLVILYCTDIQCPLPKITNGEIVESTSRSTSLGASSTGNETSSNETVSENSLYTYGDVLHVACHPGFYIVENGTIVCNEEGSWNGSICIGKSKGCRHISVYSHVSILRSPTLW